MIIPILVTLIPFFFGVFLGYVLGTRAEEARFWAAYHAVLREKGEQ